MEAILNDWLVERSAQGCFIVIIAYMIHWVIRHRSIDHRMAWYLTGAIICVDVGTMILHIWPRDLYGSHWYLLAQDWEFFEVKEFFFGFYLYRVIFYVFGALTVHFLIYASAHLVALCRTKRQRRANLVHVTLGLLVILGKCLMVFFIWCSYAVEQSEYAREQAEAPWGVPGNTEQYLKDWLATEPGSPHARYLWDRYNGIDNPDNDEAFFEAGRVWQAEQDEEKKRRAARDRLEQEERRKQNADSPSTGDSLDDLLNDLGGDEADKE